MTTLRAGHGPEGAAEGRLVLGSISWALSGGRRRLTSSGCSDENSISTPPWSWRSQHHDSLKAGQKKGIVPLTRDVLARTDPEECSSYGGGASQGISKTLSVSCDSLPLDGD